MAKVNIVGIGPGDKKYLTIQAIEVIRSADYLVGGIRHLELFKENHHQTFAIKNNLSEVLTFIKSSYDKGSLVVLASGDPGFYGILNFLSLHFSKDELEVIPGISSIQLACSKLSLPWHDACLTSVHGRPIKNLLNFLHYEKIVLLTDTKNTPEAVAEFILMHQQNRKVYICEHLSTKDEKIVETTLLGVSKARPNSFAVMVILECI